MNTGQTMITMLSMMMLTLLSVRINSSILQTQISMQNSKFGLASISLATSVIENANKLAFDEVTLENAIISTTPLTKISALGKDTGENTPSQFDDFDDYDDYQYDEKTLTSAYYHISCKVTYLNHLTPNIDSNSPTFHKKLTVSVSSVSMTDTVKISTVFSYWYFR